MELSTEEWKESYPFRHFNTWEQQFIGLHFIFGIHFIFFSVLLREEAEIAIPVQTAEHNALRAQCASLWMCCL